MNIVITANYKWNSGSLPLSMLRNRRRQMRLCFVFWGVAVLNTPAYFAFHHLLFGSWDSWWVACADWERVLWKRPVGQEETCGCKRQMPRPRVLCTKSNRVRYTACLHKLFQEAKIRGKQHPDGWCVSGTACSAETCGYEWWELLFMMWCAFPLSYPPWCMAHEDGRMSWLFLTTHLQSESLWVVWFGQNTPK